MVSIVRIYHNQEVHCDPPEPALHIIDGEKQAVLVVDIA